jgi:hypothetical protein
MERMESVQFRRHRAEKSNRYLTGNGRGRGRFLGGQLTRFASVASVANQRNAAPHAHRPIAARRWNPFSHSFDPFNPYPKLLTPRIAQPLPRTTTAARAGSNKLEIRIKRIERIERKRQNACSWHSLFLYSCAGRGSIVSAFTGTCTSSRNGLVMSTTRMRGNAFMNAA